MYWQNNYNQQYSGYYIPLVNQQPFQPTCQPQQKSQQLYQSQPPYHQAQFYQNHNYHQSQASNYNPSPWQQGMHQQYGGFNAQLQNQPPKYIPQHSYQQQHERRNLNKNRQNQNYGNTLQGKATLSINLRCEPCERDFNSDAALIAHQKMHVKCEVESCSYVASSKAVKLHYIQTHAEGKFRICLQTPEEIQRWKEERKRNWPTADNIARKKQKKADNERDGITIETKEFTYCDRKAERGRGRGGRGRYNHNRNKYRDKEMNAEVNTVPNDIMMSVKKENPLYENSRELVTLETNLKKSSVNEAGVDSSKTSSGLSLLQLYAPDASDEEEINNNICTKQINNNTVLHSKTENRMNSTVNLEKEEGEIESDVDTSAPQALNNNHIVESIGGKPTKNTDWTLKQEKNARKKSNKNKTRIESKRPTLLEMLLANEIRHERNVTLQCIRHIIKENFFGVSK